MITDRDPQTSQVSLQYHCEAQNNLLSGLTTDISYQAVGRREVLQLPSSSQSQIQLITPGVVPTADIARAEDGDHDKDGQQGYLYQYQPPGGVQVLYLPAHGVMLIGVKQCSVFLKKCHLFTPIEI